VKQIKNRDNFVEFISEFKADKKLLVFGSSWEAEEKMAQILSQKLENFKIIIAPHDLKRVQNLKQIFPKAILYSELKSNYQLPNTNILIIDCIGLLSKLYSYADLAIVGGGFHSSGLHNILEAATFGIPVFFGNHYKKNPEADGLIAANGAKSFENETETAGFLINSLNEDSKDNLVQMGKNAEQFINNQPNASQIIIKKIGESLS
jgi:3-deoxy-D-manno-octulosonic-acid transferase